MSAACPAGRARRRLWAWALLAAFATPAAAWTAVGPVAPSPSSPSAPPAPAKPAAAAPKPPPRSLPAVPACPPALPQATAAEQAAPARDRGLLWRATRDERTLWLYGTLHVGRPHWNKPGPRVAEALRASEVLALEIDPADPALAQAMAELDPPRRVPATLQQRLEQAYRRACMAPEAMAALHPLLQVTTLTVMESRWSGMDALYGAEIGLLQAARAAGRAVVALETPAEQVRALVPADEAEAMALLEQNLGQLEDTSARRVLERLAEAWERGDEALLADPERWCGCTMTAADRALLARMTDQRNAALAERIVALHRQGRRVFAAVGALHMAGPQALPRLLEQRGFRVERVAF